MLCVGDLLLSLNNADCSNLTQHQIVQVQFINKLIIILTIHHDQKLDTTDKVQLEVKYRLPPVGPSPRARTKVIQVNIVIIRFIIVI